MQCKEYENEECTEMIISEKTCLICIIKKIYKKIKDDAKE
jgi:hypothetical protein